MTFRFSLRWILAALVIPLLNGCGSVNTVSDLVTSHIPTFHEGKASVVVSLSQQKAILLKGGEEVAESRISTGREGYETPVGHFKVIRLDDDHRSSLYGDYVNADGAVGKANVDTRKHSRPAGAHFLGASMPYFVEFKQGYGFHAGYLPGFPASHGCVRMPYWKARQFYYAVDLGAPIIVRR